MKRRQTRSKILHYKTRVRVKLVRPGESAEEWVTTVRDRDFNDTRYDINSTKLMELGWKPEVEFDKGFEETVLWYSRDAIPNGFWSNIRMNIAHSSVDHPRDPASPLF